MTHHHSWPDFDSKQIYGQLVNIDKNILIPDLCNIISNYALHTTKLKWRITKLGIEVAKTGTVPSACPTDIQILHCILRNTSQEGWKTDERIVRGLTYIADWCTPNYTICKERCQFLIKNLPSFLRAMEDVGFATCIPKNAKN